MKTLLFGLLCTTVLLGGCKGSGRSYIESGDEVMCMSSAGFFTGIVITKLSEGDMLLQAYGKTIKYEEFLCAPTVSDQKFSK